MGSCGRGQRETNTTEKYPDIISIKPMADSICYRAGFEASHECADQVR